MRDKKWLGKLLSTRKGKIEYILRNITGEMTLVETTFNKTKMIPEDARIIKRVFDKEVIPFYNRVVKIAAVTGDE
jgi:hypothetical protein